MLKLIINNYSLLQVLLWGVLENSEAVLLLRLQLPMKPKRLAKITCTCTHVTTQAATTTTTGSIKQFIHVYVITNNKIYQFQL